MAGHLDCDFVLVSKPARVFLVEDDGDLRRSMRRMLVTFGLEVADYESGEDFLAAGPSIPAVRSCLLLDMGLPGMDGLEVQASLAAREWRPPIVMVSGQAEIPIAVQAIRRGAFDFLEKPILPRELRPVLSKALAEDEARIKARCHKTELKKDFSHLSGRERDVLERIVNAQNSKQIASELHIGVKTVLKHRSNIFKKMKVRNEIELFALINQIEEGIDSLLELETR